MTLHTIQKQKLLAEPYSDDALKLARAIYSTYVKDEKDPYMKIKTSIVIKLLKLEDHENPLLYIKMLLEELNEPIAVKNFKYYATIYPVRLLTFCTYTLDAEYLELELNEEFLHAEKEYMTDPFLSH
ncbi:MAG: hypothetical protein PHS10_04975 [Thiovulaceae bacterium]|nr:hypothetical protein [Sulfurimonadaceae bacterium]